MSKNMSKKSQPSDDQNQIMEELAQQVAELTEALQRERADVTNIRRRHDEQLASIKSLVKAQVIEELLPVIDNFERALKHVPKELENNDYIKGVQGVVKQFETTLKTMGVEKIATVGQVFNPHFHEAVGVAEQQEAAAPDTVVEELQSGYQIGDTVIRHAMVKVSA